MENLVYQINNNSLEALRGSLAELSGVFVAEIDGNRIDALSSYLEKINEVFKFPYPSKSLDGYLDWMTDLSWLQADGFVLIIRNYKNFMKNDPMKKEKVMWLFEEDILPFWQDGVTKYVVDGKPKLFKVYLVD